MINKMVFCDFYALRVFSKNSVGGRSEICYNSFTEFLHFY